MSLVLLDSLRVYIKLWQVVRKEHSEPITNIIYYANLNLYEKR